MTTETKATTLRDGTEVLAKSDGDAWKGMNRAMVQAKIAKLAEQGEHWEPHHTMSGRVTYLRRAFFIAHDGTACIGVGNSPEEATEEPRNNGFADDEFTVYRTDYRTATALFDSFGAAALSFDGEVARLAS